MKALIEFIKDFFMWVFAILIGIILGAVIGQVVIKISVWILGKEGFYNLLSSFDRFMQFFTI